jgi:hypothetical protein
MRTAKSMSRMHVVLIAALLLVPVVVAVWRNGVLSDCFGDLKRGMTQQQVYQCFGEPRTVDPGGEYVWWPGEEPVPNKIVVRTLVFRSWIAPEKWKVGLDGLGRVQSKVFVSLE